MGVHTGCITRGNTGEMLLHTKKPRGTDEGFGVCGFCRPVTVRLCTNVGTNVLCRNGTAIVGPRGQSCNPRAVSRVAWAMA